MVQKENKISYIRFLLTYQKYSLQLKRLFEP